MPLASTNSTASEAGAAQQNLPLPDSRSMDWNSLVNTATKAINTDDETTIVDLEAPEGANSSSKKAKKTDKRYANAHMVTFFSTVVPPNSTQ